MATSFASAVNNIGNYVGSPYRSSGGGTLTLTAAHNIPSSAFNSGGWVRVSITRAGVPVTILKATAAPSSTTLTISGVAPNENPSVSDANTQNGDVAELRITSGAFTDIQTAVNNLENNGSVIIGKPVSGGTSKSVLYVDGSGNLAQNNSDFQWDHSTATLTLTTTTNNNPFIVTNNYTGGAGPAALRAERGNSGTSNQIGFISLETSLSTTNPYWVMGTRANTHNFSFSSWDGTNVLDYFATAEISGAAGIGFYTSAPVAKQTVTGSRGGNAALASALTALANLGLITNSTT